MFCNVSLRVSESTVDLQLILYWEKALNKHEVAGVTHWNKNSSLSNVAGTLMKNMHALNLIK